MRRTRQAQAGLPRATHSISSGMGGAFDVRIVEELGPERVHVAVTMHRNPDWNGYSFTARRAALRPLAA